ncbi:hypothetical protein MRX96_041701 [Rhipicephalus microplus]
MGVMNLGPRSEKQLSANNEHDMYFCALDDGVKLTMLGSVLMSLPKKSFFYVCRGFVVEEEKVTAAILHPLVPIRDKAHGVLPHRSKYQLASPAKKAFSKRSAKLSHAHWQTLLLRTPLIAVVYKRYYIERHLDVSLKGSTFYKCREPDTVRDTCIHVCHVRNLLLYLDPVMPAVALTVIPWPCSLTPHEEIYWACSLCREIVAGRHQSSSMFPENNARLIQRHEFVRGPASKMYGF